MGVGNGMFASLEDRKRPVRSRLMRYLLILVATLFTSGMTPWSNAQAHSFKVLYAFCPGSNCPNGAAPLANVIIDTSGNLLGTTSAEGGANAGTVFRLAPNPATGRWSATTLHWFCSQVSCADGQEPVGPLIADAAGNFYGTTTKGGTFGANCPDDSGCGTVFKLAQSAKTGKWTFQVLYAFCPSVGCPDGQSPEGALIMDQAGSLYGTTSTGGGMNQGNVFKLTLNPATGAWSETVLHSFCARGTACLDGRGPNTGVIMDANGSLYGTTSTGGAKNGGTVFKLTLNAANGRWGEVILHNFCSKPNCIDGRAPQASLIIDKAGNLYGTTSAGGALNGGAVFELAQKAATGGWTETILRSFCTGAGCPDGQASGSSLIMDGAGNLYGTTRYGGAHCQANFPCGTVFELSPTATGTWSETVLHSFCALSGCKDGAVPSGLAIDPAGNLFGTTQRGGNQFDFLGLGTVFELVND